MDATLPCATSLVDSPCCVEERSPRGGVPAEEADRATAGLPFFCSLPLPTTCAPAARQGVVCHGRPRRARLAGDPSNARCLCAARTRQRRRSCCRLVLHRTLIARALTPTVLPSALVLLASLADGCPPTPPGKSSDRKEPTGLRNPCSTRRRSLPRPHGDRPHRRRRRQGEELSHAVPNEEEGSADREGGGPYRTACSLPELASRSR